MTRMKSVSNEPYHEGYTAFENRDDYNPHRESAEQWDKGFAGEEGDDSAAYESGVEAKKKNDPINPYEDDAGNWDEGYNDADAYYAMLDIDEPRKGDMVQLTGDGAFQATHDHDCPRCGTRIPKGWWCEPLGFYGPNDPSEVIVCSASCKAREYSGLIDQPA